MGQQVGFQSKGGQIYKLFKVQFCCCITFKNNAFLQFQICVFLQLL